MSVFVLDRRKSVVAALLCTVAAGIAIVSVTTSATVETLLLEAIGLVLLSGILVRVLQGKFDVFEPLTIFVTMWSVLFLARPIAMLLTGNLEVPIYQIRDGMPGMLLMALTGAVGFLSAYAASAGHRIGERLRALPEIHNFRRAGSYAIVLAAIGVFLFGVFIASSGGLSILQALMSGRQENAIVSAELSTTAYLRGALALTLPASLVLFFVASKRRSPGLGLVALIVALLGLTVSGPSGIRGWILPYVGAPLVLLYLSRKTRPRFVAVLALSFLGFTLNGFIAEARDTATRQSTSASQLLIQNFTHLGDSWTRFVLGGDTEMPNLLALEVIKVPSAIPFQFGGATGQVFIQPIPRQLWPSKPRSGDEVLTQKLFIEPGINSASRQYTPMANFYLDFGYLGVFLGMGFVGMLARIYYEYLQANLGNRSVQLLYAATLPFFVPLLRGSIGDAAGRLIFIVPPLLVGIYFARRPPADPGVSVWRSSHAATVQDVRTLS